MGRSLGFASTTTNLFALFRLAFASDPRLNRLTMLVTVTRRLIMQKARRHRSSLLRPLVSVWFQDLFHSLIQGSFHLSLTVLVHYRSLRSI
jgi:membrane-associated PAP2 superfamily phosphatase